jgi:hypothetical protein
VTLVIEHGHQHHMQPVARNPRPGEASREDGSYTIHYSCACYLEQRITFDENGNARMMQLRVGGVWFDSLQLARLDAPVMECPACLGFDSPLSVCESCLGLGVMQRDGQRFTPPDFAAR